MWRGRRGGVFLKILLNFGKISGARNRIGALNTVPNEDHTPQGVQLIVAGHSCSEQHRWSPRAP